MHYANIKTREHSTTGGDKIPAFFFVSKIPHTFLRIPRNNLFKSSQNGKNKFSVKINTANVAIFTAILGKMIPLFFR